MVVVHECGVETDVHEGSKPCRSMRTNTRLLIEARPPKTADKAVVFAVVLGITVLSSLLFTGLLVAGNVHAAITSHISGDSYPPVM